MALEAINEPEACKNVRRECIFLFLLNHMNPVCVYKNNTPIPFYSCELKRRGVKVEDEGTERRTLMPKLDHIAVRVSDLDQAIAFYTNMLKLTLQFRELDAEHHEAFAFLRMDDGTNLELLQLLDEQNQPLPYTPPPPDASHCPHIALGCADLAGCVGSLTLRGVPLVKGPMEIPGKVRWAYLADPDGNIIELVQWLDR